MMKWIRRNIKEVVVLIAAAMLLCCAIVCKRQEGFTRQEVFFNDLIKLGAHIRLDAGIPLTQGEKAALCDVAFRLPPPGGMPDAARVMGQEAETALDLGAAGVGVGMVTGSGGGSLWLRRVHNKKGMPTTQDSPEKGSAPAGEVAKMLLSTSGTY